MSYIQHGIRVREFIIPFRGDFKGQFYNPAFPPSYSRANNESCRGFESFITDTIAERLRNGLISVWGKVSACIPPHLVMPLTIEPSKPRL